MFKDYQIKWYLIMTSILATSSLLLRPSSLVTAKWWEFIVYFVHISVLLLICWLIHGYFLLHKFLSFHIYSKQILSIIAATTLAFILNYLLHFGMPQTGLIDNTIKFDTLADFTVHFTGAFFISIICYVIFYSIHTNSALQNAKLDNEILEQAHLRAQLLSLQQQISPHFLFNSLSTLKTIANDQPTKSYIIQLAAVYRYVLNFNEHYLAVLNDELTFIKSYLYIMNERFEEALHVTINISESALSLLIPPLSLQLLIENAIKHNSISPEQPLYITIVSDDTPALIVKNNIQPKKVREEGTGTGLRNIKERIKLLANKSVEVVNDGEYFSVKLPLLRK